jgi:hypothetical protein
MKLKKRYLTIALSVMVFIVNLSCAKQIVTTNADYAITHEETDSLPDESFNEKLKRISRAKGISVNGTIAIKGKGKDLKGSFVMSINGDDMDMHIFTNGISQGSITLKGSLVNVSPLLDDEYLEYMFAVILRDSVKWWNIYEYDVIKTEDYYLMRNSWKKVYVNKLMLVPEKQIVRLTNQREVVISYDEIREYGFGLLPSRIDFKYRSYRCVLYIERFEIKEMIKTLPDQDPSQPF